MSVSEQQFAELVRERRSALMKLCYLLTGQPAEAEDLLQDALLRVYLALPTIAEGGALEAYARTAIVRTNVTRWRRWGRRHAVATLDDVPDRGDELTTVDDSDEVWRLLRTLGPRQRAVVVLRFYQDLTIDQIAAEMSISRGTAKSQLARALSRLRTQLPNRPREGALR